jgi:hypothetical protein
LQIGSGLTSLQFNVGWKLALVLKGLAPASFVESYNSERIPVIAAMLNKTTELLNTTMPLGGKMNFDNFTRSSELDMLGINYRGSPIVLDERTADDGTVYNAYGTPGGEATLRAGDRAPDAPGLIEVQKRITTALFDIFGVTHHTILVFGDRAVTQAVAIAGLVKRFPVDVFRVVACLAKNHRADVAEAGLGGAVMIVKDGEGHAYGSYMLENQESGIFIVRPDGILGAITISTEGLDRYLKLLFGNV